MVEAHRGIHALALAVRETGITGDAAAPITHGLCVGRGRTRKLAPTTVIRVGVGVDTDARTIELRLGTPTSASALDAQLTLGAAMAALSAMIRVRVDVHAGSVALQRAGVARERTSPIDTDGFGVGRSITGAVAGAAMIGVPGERAARPATLREAGVAADFAGSLGAAGAAMTRRNALCPAASAVKHAELEVNAGPRTFDQTGNAVRRAHPVRTHFVRRARRAAGAAVFRVARQLHAAIVAFGQARGTARHAFPIAARAARPGAGLAADSAGPAVGRILREVDAATAAQRQGIIAQRYAVPFHTRLLSACFARAGGMATTTMPPITPELDALATAHSFAFLASRRDYGLIRVALRDTSGGGQVTGISLDAACLLVACEPFQVAADVARTRSAEQKGAGHEPADQPPTARGRPRTRRVRLAWVVRVVHEMHPGALPKPASKR